MKLGSACLQCRSGKRKCDRALGTACEQCKKRGLQCSSLRRDATAALLPIPQPVSSIESSSLPPAEVVKELVDLYICYIHNKPHSLFHEPSLRQAARDGTLNHGILFGIAGLSARFSANPQVRNQGHVFANQARIFVQTNIENICLENVQALIIVGNICFAGPNSDSESLYFGKICPQDSEQLVDILAVIANRMAQLLQLHKEDPADNEIAREVKRRVWWSLYLIDQWASAGLGLPRHFRNGVPVPRLPMDEVAFSQLIIADNSRNVELLKNWQPGIWSHMISLVKIFGLIQDLNHELVNQTHWEENSIEQRVLSLAEQLANFEYELPSTMVYTLDNLDFHVRRGEGRTFVALHLGYHHYCTLLYYQYLDQRRPPTPNTRILAQRCKHHATEYCELIRTSNQRGGAEALYNIVGHMTVVSSSVLLHTLLFGDDQELPLARHRLESNYEFLVKLREIWPSVDIMMQRLIAFQDACLRTAQVDTHRFDKWMVKFLLHHALALDEKDPTATPPQSGIPVGPVENMRLLERSRVTESIIRAPYVTL